MEPYLFNPQCHCMRCRLKTAMGPVVLITLGVLFLVAEFHVASFGRTWPILLIAIGLVKFGQNAAPTTDHTNPPVPYVEPVPQQGYVQQSYVPPAPPAPPQATGDEGQVNHV